VRPEKEEHKKREECSPSQESTEIVETKTGAKGKAKAAARPQKRAKEKTEEKHCISTRA
jgi:hypothetical protein